MMKNIKITIQNPIISRVNEPDAIKPALAYNSVYWRQTRFGRHQESRKAYLVNRQGFFHTGLADRIQKFCGAQGLHCEVFISNEMAQIDSEVQATCEPSLPGTTLRNDQVRLINSALEKRRGLIVSPMGTGKTIVAMAFLSSFPQAKVLYLVPKLDLMRQTQDEMVKYGFNSVGTVGDGCKLISEQITVGTYQTVRKLDLAKIGHIFDILIVDETHGAMEYSSSHHQILSQIPAPVRIGFTATPPTDTQKMLVCEGLIGPIIDRVTFKEGEELQILAEPYLRLVPVPPKQTSEKSYSAVYNDLIVSYNLRHKIVIGEAQDLVNEGMTVLIFISLLEHGKKLYELAKRGGISCAYVHGSVDSAERKQIKNQLNNGEIKLVIASVVWKEGLNIPNLGSIVLAHGGKSETALIQGIGRALRRTKDKKHAVIVDFIDRGKFVSEHFCDRMAIYSEMGWI